MTGNFSAARMVANSTFISIGNNVLTLVSKPVSGQPPRLVLDPSKNSISRMLLSTSNPHPAIHYFSGTVFAKQQVVVDGTTVTGFDVQGEFISPTAVGTWPAFWLTAVNGWPPEADIGEWKGV